MCFDAFSLLCILLGHQEQVMWLGHKKFKKNTDVLKKHIHKAKLISFFLILTPFKYMGQKCTFQKNFTLKYAVYSVTAQNFFKK